MKQEKINKIKKTLNKIIDEKKCRKAMISFHNEHLMSGLGGCEDLGIIVDCYGEKDYFQYNSGENWCDQVPTYLTEEEFDEELKKLSDNLDYDYDYFNM